MGNILKVLSNRDESADKKLNFYVDFEKCQPTDAERETYCAVHEVMRSSRDVLTALQQYKPASHEIRAAISNPVDNNLQVVAWKTVLPLAEQLKHFFEYSLKIQSVVPLLLDTICANDCQAADNLEKHPSLFKQFAEVLDFTLMFDDLKMANPYIQNDFSYYRRRLKSSSSDHNDRLDRPTVNNEDADRMSLFYAYPTPMLKAVSESTTRFVTENKNLEITSTTDCLKTMATICRLMIEKKEYCERMENEETQMFCLRVMVGVIILYDHVHPVGAFDRTSGIDVKSAIRLLKSQTVNRTEGLLNALRYNTKHLKDENTPKAIKSMLA